MGKSGRRENRRKSLSADNPASPTGQPASLTSGWVFLPASQLNGVSRRSASCWSSMPLPVSFVVDQRRERPR